MNSSLLLFLVWLYPFFSFLSVNFISVFLFKFCCFQSASPDSTHPQPPPRRRRHSKKLVVITEQKNASCESIGGPHTAPSDDSSSPFTFDLVRVPAPAHRSQSIGSTSLVSDMPAPGLNIIPATPMSDRKGKEDAAEDVQDVESGKHLESASPRKMIATRTTSLPLVTLPSEILNDNVVVIKTKSQSQENFTTSHPELVNPETEEKSVKTVDTEHETKSHHHSQKYSIKSFKKRLKKGVKKRDRSSEKNQKTIDPNENHISLDTEVTHDDLGSHGSRSETEEYPVSDDDLLNPGDDHTLQGDKKEGFFRRMSVKMKQLVSRHDDDQESEGESRKIKKQDRVMTVTDLTDDSEGSKPVCAKKTLKELLSHTQGRCLLLGEGQLLLK